MKTLIDAWPVWGMFLLVAIAFSCSAEKARKIADRDRWVSNERYSFVCIGARVCR